MPKFRRILWLILFDQGLKQWVIYRGFFQLNQGIAFGWGSHWQWFWLIITLGVLIWFGIKFKFSWTVSLIISGGLSNWLDRILRGGVVDYISLPLLPVFNLGDGFIVAGVLSLMYSLIYGANHSF
ncbi:MAG: signal peptidase II [Candidatus Beckwithbacteria bacterium]